MLIVPPPDTDIKRTGLPLRTEPLPDARPHNSRRGPIAEFRVPTPSADGLPDRSKTCPDLDRYSMQPDFSGHSPAYTLLIVGTTAASSLRQSEEQSVHPRSPLERAAASGGSFCLLGSPALAC